MKRYRCIKYSGSGIGYPVGEIIEVCGTMINDSGEEFIAGKVILTSGRASGIPWYFTESELEEIPCTSDD